jgi:multimeric flavodoxin WrbA
MKIVVLSGSPKGETSVTMQYVRYLQKEFPQHELKIIQAAQPIKRIENNRESFQEIIHEVRSADGVLWAFPLYYFLVSSQYKRFIELIWERNEEKFFKDKYAAALSTSIHFYDHTAHNYIRSICDDLNMMYVGYFAAHMQELLKKEGQTRVKLFAQEFFDVIEKRLATQRIHPPINWNPPEYRPSSPDHGKIPTDKNIVIVTDTRYGNIGKMIDRFAGCFSTPVNIVNLTKLNIKGGCHGCLRCGQKNICAYAGKDDFIEMYNTKLKTADIVIFAGEIKDRYLSARWKLFFDRSFFNTHQRSLAGKQFAFFISGPLSQVSNLKEILAVYTEMQNSNLVGFITDEQQDSTHIDSALQGLAQRLHWFSQRGYTQPNTFRGVGGMKVFRDDVWGSLRFVFRADHKTYRKNGVYDFPQSKILQNVFLRIMYYITGIPWIGKRFMENLTKLMIMPYKKVLRAR